MKTVTRGEFLTLLRTKKPIATLRTGASMIVDNGSAIEWFDSTIEHGWSALIGVTEGNVWIGIGHNSCHYDVRELKGRQ